MAPDLAGLRAAYQNNPQFKQLLEQCGQESPRIVVRVAYLLRHNRRVPALARPEVLRELAQLAALGFGSLLEPTRKERARFAWRVRATEALHLARNPGATLTIAAFLPGGKPELPAATPPADGLSRQTVQLCPGREASFTVPEDLTAEEAEWLGSYLVRYARQWKRAGTDGGKQH